MRSVARSWSTCGFVRADVVVVLLGEVRSVEERSTGARGTGARSSVGVDRGTVDEDDDTGGVVLRGAGARVVVVLDELLEEDELGWG